MHKKLFCLFVLTVVCFAELAYAGAVIRPGGVGPRALSVGGAYTAIADDISAFYYNPAGLSQVENGFWQVGAESVFTEFHYRTPDSWGSNTYDSQAVPFPLPFMGWAQRINDRLVVGIGVLGPQGIGAQFSNHKELGLRYRESFLGLATITQGLSYEITDELSIGAGLDIGFGQLRYHAPLQLGNLVLNPIMQQSEGKGFGMGGKLGLLWKPTDRLSLGFTYAAPLKVDLEGRTEVKILGYELMTDRFETDFGFAGRAGAGIVFQATPRLRISADVNWYDFSGAQKLPFNFKKLPTITQPLKWDDNYSVHLGAQYQLSKNWDARIGGCYLWGSIPEDTTNPTIPDADGWFVGTGLGWHKDDWAVDIAYGYANAKRGVGERPFYNVAPGDYEMDIHTVSVAVSRKF